MTVVVPDGLEPLGVWESAGPEVWADGAPRLPRVAWLNTHGISTDRLRRIEFYLTDAPFAVLYRVRAHPDAVSWYNPAPEETTAEPPVVQMLGELPPAHLLTQP